MMNLKTPKFNTNFWIVIGTLTFLIFCYFVYLEYYVVNKENRIVSTRFRVLDQLGDNINAKIASYTDNALQLEQKILEEAGLLKDILDSYNYDISTAEIVQYLYEEFLHKQNSEYLNKDLELVGFKIDQGSSAAGIDSVGLVEKNFKLTETNTYYYFPPFLIEIESEYQGKVDTFRDSLLIRTSYKNLVKGLLREDVFDGMFIVRNDEVIFSTLKSDLLIDNLRNGGEKMVMYLVKQELSKIELGSESDASGVKSALPGRILSGEFTDITISNKSYKLFFKPVEVEGEYWYIGGLMETRNFTAAGKSIAPWVVILLSLMLILVVLALPIVKLKVISKTEQLETGTIVSSALAILFGASILTLFLLYLSQSSSHLQNTDERLKQLSKAIDTTFNMELDSALKQLEFYDVNYKEIVADSILTRSGKPIFDKILNKAKDSYLFPSIYPYADFYFWIDTSGVQSAYFTPFIDRKEEMTNLAHRDYFNFKDEWFFPPDTSKKFRLQSILSITSGNHKLAMAAPSATINPVIALSSQFYSLIDPIIPKNFGYNIIDEAGNVWFHSDKERNLMENFISECNDDKGLKAAMYNRIAKPISANYYNDPHRIYIKPLSYLPLHLVTFYNMDNETSFQAQVFTLVATLISAFFLLIFLQVILLLVLERQFQWKLTKNLIMKITRPMVHLGGHYKFLMWVYLFVLAATAIAITFAGRVQSFALIYMVEVIVFVFSYRVLNDNELKRQQTIWFSFINLGILILMNVGMFVLISEQGFWILGFELLLIVCLEMAYLIFKSKNQEPDPAINKAFIRNHAVHLILMAAVFSVLPTMVFYKIAYNTEAEIRLRHSMVDLMKKREDRNKLLNHYYASIIDSTAARDILNKRKQKGIYTEFLNQLKFSPKPLPHGEFEKDEYQHSLFDSMIVFLRPYYDDEIVEDKYLVFSKQKNSNKYWIKYKRDSLVLKYLSYTDDPLSAQLRYNRIAADITKLNFWKPYHGKMVSGKNGYVFNLVFWLLLLFLLYCFYFLVKFGVRNIYSLDIVANYSDQSFAELLRHQTLANKDIFIVKLSPRDDTRLLTQSIHIDLRLNWAGKTAIANSGKKIRKCLADHKKTIKSSSISTAGQQPLKKDFITVFIDHFEWSYTDQEILNQELNTLWAFVNHKDIRLIIQTDIHPDKILDHYREIFKIASKEADIGKSSGNTDLTSLKNLLNNLQRLINNTIINQLPVKCNISGFNEKGQCGKAKVPLKPTGLIDEELSASDYLLQFKGALDVYFNSYIKDHDLESPEEMIVAKVSSLADNYYEDLFNSCSAEEQYVMFDLAEDMIVNPKNSKAIFGLLEKGIFIKKCDKLNFMNVSFRRYVQSRYNKSDTSALEIQIGKEAGTWQGYRTTLILFIVGLFVFIAMANQSFMENLNQVFVLIGGGVAVITGILGLLSRMSKTVDE